MGFDRRFTAVTLLLVGGLGLAIAALTATIAQPGLAAARIVAGAGVVALVVALVAHVERTNVALARFVEALHHDDLAARITERGGGSFAVLSRSLNDAVRRLAADRARGLDELRFWEALVDDVPVALLLVDDMVGVRALNKAARGLFDRHDGVRAADFAVYGPRFAERLDEPSVAQEIIAIDAGSGPVRAIVRTAAIARLGAPVRVVAVEPVGGALDRLEVGTQSDVVRVLCHEILNSLTPVVSLAGTAAVLLGEEEPDVAEARLAVTTLARRSEGLRRFIDSYRAVARVPEPRLRRFAAEPFAAELARLFAVEWLEHRLTVSVEPALAILADPDLLAQVLINLLRNAAQASVRGGGGAVRLTMARTGQEGAVVTVEDDGPGIAPDLHGEIFLPFFTTRAEGTGIGLSLVRQILVAHGWSIQVGTSDLGGAAFRLSSR